MGSIGRIDRSLRMQTFLWPRRVRRVGRRALPLALVLVTVFGCGLYIGQQREGANAAAQDRAAMRQEIRAMSLELAALKRESRTEAEGLNAQLGRLRAHVDRVDALGERLVQLADLDSEGFDFNRPPALGGLNQPIEAANAPQSWGSLQHRLSTFERRLQAKAEDLEVIAGFLQDQSSHAARTPEGQPVTGGWVSSAYGHRLDPFSGDNSFHSGVDIAVQGGTPIRTVATGVVTRSTWVDGYGYLVEIDHGNGYRTRYAHNRRNLVEVGDIVSKGQTIALVGSTGRSTGNHIHFEVRHRDQPVDPTRYLER